VSAGARPSPERVLELLGRVLPHQRADRFEARDGIPACPLAAPSTFDEAAEVVRLARAERWALVPVGHGSKLGWTRPPERCDLVLSSRNLRGITAYEPADGTLTALAGTSWSELVDATRACHHLSPEVPGAERASLGGVLAAGASGLDRLRHGPARHQVLGMLALHPDGTRVKSGGRVVKNVTGYDLHRLWCGSQGTLCFLLEATLRLYPAPAATAVLATRCPDLGAALARAHALLRAGVQPLTVVLRSEGTGFELCVVLAGREESVASEVGAARAALGDGEVRLGDDARHARAELRERELAGGRWPPLVVACRPSRLGAALARLAAVADELRLETRLVCHPLLATAAVDFRDEPGAAWDDARVAALERGLAADGVQLVWRGLGARTPPVRIASAAAELMRRIKSSLDPDGLFARALP
jgi:glycolate oxidase FAD binding subunit